CLSRGWFCLARASFASRDPTSLAYVFLAEGDTFMDGARRASSLALLARAFSLLEWSAYRVSIGVPEDNVWASLVSARRFDLVVRGTSFPDLSVLVLPVSTYLRS